MKTIISEVDGFKTIVELKPVSTPAGYTELKFSTEWDRARRDGSEQVKYRLLLNQQQLKNLKDIL